MAWKTPAELIAELDSIRRVLDGDEGAVEHAPGQTASPTARSAAGHGGETPTDVGRLLRSLGEAPPRGPLGSGPSNDAADRWRGHADAVAHAVGDELASAGWERDVAARAADAVAAALPARLEAAAREVLREVFAAQSGHLERQLTDAARAEAAELAGRRD